MSRSSTGIAFQILKDGRLVRLYSRAKYSSLPVP
jgi:hypothetical protein